MIDEKALHAACMAAAPLGFVSTTQIRKAIEAYEAAKDPVSLDEMVKVYMKTQGQIKTAIKAVLEAAGVRWV